MGEVWRTVRRRVLTPSVSETRLDTRGFHAKNEVAGEMLETIGRSFVTGFGYAAHAQSPAEAEHRLETVNETFRGFAYEGAAMGFAIMDALKLGGGRCVERFLAGKGSHHVYMVNVGVGWALARLPRWLWSRVFPKDPLLAWLALDGYGFHQAYFRTEQYVHLQYRAEHLPWPVGPFRSYSDPVIDQGIGRALWFIEGTDVDRVAARIRKFPGERRADLWSGAGLAITYASGANKAELESFRHQAGEYRHVVAQGSAFAAKARVLSGLVTPDTYLATEVICGMSPQRAAAVTDTALADLPYHSPRPPFEIWRQRIVDEFTTHGR